MSQKQTGALFKNNDGKIIIEMAPHLGFDMVWDTRIPEKDSFCVCET